MSPGSLSVLSVSCMVALTFSTPASGQTSGHIPNPADARTLNVTDPPKALRALEFELAFRPFDQIEGDASAQWYQACILHGNNAARGSLVTDWLAKEPSEFDQDAAWAAVSGFIHDVYPVLLVAAKRDQCDWGTPIRTNSIGTLLPELATLRDIGRSLALKARIELLNNDFAAAAETLTIGLELACDLGRSPTLIQGLVGLAVGSIICEQLERWVQTPAAPSLYWPLSRLENPLVSLRRAYTYESSMLDFTFPDLKRLQSGGLSPEAAAALSADLFSNLQSIDAGDVPNSPTDPLGAAASAAANFPAARAYLISQGVTPAEIDALPVPFVTLRWQLESFQKHSDEVFKWSALPYAEIEPALLNTAAATAAELRAAQDSQPMLVILPAINNSFVSSVLLERRIALLRAVEALRLHATTHNSFPQSLAEVTDIPVPNDPVTGLPFEYRLDTAAAVLSGRAPKLAGHQGGFERRLIRTRAGSEAEPPKK